MSDEDEWNGDDGLEWNGDEFDNPTLMDGPTQPASASPLSISP